MAWLHRWQWPKGNCSRSSRLFGRLMGGSKLSPEEATQGVKCETTWSKMIRPLLVRERACSRLMGGDGRGGAESSSPAPPEEPRHPSASRSPSLQLEDPPEPHREPHSEPHAPARKKILHICADATHTDKAHYKWRDILLKMFCNNLKQMKINEAEASLQNTQHWGEVVSSDDVTEV